MSSKTHITDVAIIGAGPTGLFAVFECGMLNMSCHVIDNLEHIGGQCMALYPEKPIYDIPAYPCINGAELIEKLITQAEPFSPTYHLNQAVTTLLKDDDGLWRITTSKGTEITAKAIIIAAGAGAFGPNRPPLEDLENYEGSSVFYMIRNRQDFAGKRLVIAGGGDSAVDWAISLADIAEHIYFVHRRPKFRAAPESLNKLSALEKEGKIEMIVPYQLTEIHGNDGLIDHIDVKTLDGDVKSLDASILLPFFGLSAQLGAIKEWGLNLDTNQIHIDPATSMTNIDRIFAVGDIATYKNKLKLILTGFSEAAMAAHAIRSIIFPDTALHFEHSTTSGVPKS